MKLSKVKKLIWGYQIFRGSVGCSRLGAWSALLFLCLSNPGTGQPPHNDHFALTERFHSESEAQILREAQYWERLPLPIPEGVIPEISGMVTIPDRRLLVTTRRGELWYVDGAYEDDPQPVFTRFTSGLHEPLGISQAPEGGYYVVQRSELTHIEDRDGDGQADWFRKVFKIPVSGNYHEFAFGPYLTREGNIRINLMLAYNAAFQSSVPWRGWILEVTPEGYVTPIASGLRAGAGAVLSSGGDWFFTENQGEWAGTSYISHIEPGDFLGHPQSLAWSHLPGSVTHLRPEDIPDTGLPLVEVADQIPGLKMPAVFIPYAIHGVSPNGIVEDTTGGKFGPFEGQFFFADSGQARIIRVSLEQVNGVWQGATYAFMGGFQAPVVRLAFGEDGSLFVGETGRGWGSVAPLAEGFERVRWKGNMPFEIQEAKIEPDGFTLHFTRPVDRKSAESLFSYGVSSFTYGYGSDYGSPPINRLSCPIRKVVVAEDGMSVRLGVLCLREGYIHEIRTSGIRAADTGEPLLHNNAYYTILSRPDGDRIVPLEEELAADCTPMIPEDAYKSTPKHPTERPDFFSRHGDQIIHLGTAPGMKFDKTLLEVRAGSQFQLVFRNTDEMMHNFVLCLPGKGQEVGMAALHMGIDGMANNYVPDSDLVLYHTAIIQPGASERLFLVAPEVPGDYDYVCTIPGHAMVMNGILRVLPADE